MNNKNHSQTQKLTSVSFLVELWWFQIDTMTLTSLTGNTGFFTDLHLTSCSLHVYWGSEERYWHSK